MSKKQKNNHFDGWGEFHGSASIGERGQVVIPKKLRDSLKLNKGDNFFVMEKDGAIVLFPTELMELFVSDLTKKIKDLKK
ncbi:MAG: AbrB/MazE/SpoVT family DNA-binding domain-containing protein [Candidatus Magasanikbacteria bacterium]|nr:AbrB/MazE/SpoVT family DNA-binding domain-containing protein [Candidatus Magasanikbacteria bacterium]